MNCKLILFLFCLLGFKINAQTINFKNYSTDLGLPQSQVLALHQDAQNVIWIGTNSGGAASFDGQKFVTYNQENGLSNNTINTITSYKQGIAFGTYSGVDILKENKFLHYNEKNGLKNTIIFKLLANNDSLFIGTQKGLYCLHNNKVKEVTIDSLLSTSNIQSLLIDNDNNLWCGTYENGLFIYNIKTKTKKWITEKDGITNNLVFSIKQFSNDTMILAARFGLYYVIKKQKIVDVLNKSTNTIISISDLNVDGKTIYAGAFDFGVFKIQDGIIKKIYNYKNGISKNAVRPILIDAEKNLWVGTDGNGLFKKNSESFTFINKNQQLPEEYINCVFEEDKTVWLGIKSNGLVKYTGGNITNYLPDAKKKNQLIDRDVNAIIRLEDKLYFGTNSGLCYLKNEEFFKFEQGEFKEKFILSLYKSNNNVLFVGTVEGLYQLNNGKVSQVNEVNQFSNNGEFIIYKIIEDNSKNIIIATNLGLIRLKNNKAELISKVDDSDVNSVCLDNRNSYWAGTESGLYVLSNSKLTPILFEKKKLGYVNFVITKDSKTLYVGTNNGLFKIDVNNYYNNKPYLKHYSGEDGLLSLESNVNAAFINNENKLFVGTVKGLEIYSPDGEVYNNLKPTTKLNSVKLFLGTENINKYSSGDTSSILPENLLLPYNKNNLTFGFVGISFSFPEKVRYQYQLVGLDENWSPITNKYEITYPSIPPGTYTFAVKACNNDGVWNETPTTYVFAISPPWYKTWWFYTLSLVFLILSVIFYNKYRVKKLVADRARLEQVVTIRTNELRKEKEKVEEINKEVIAQKQLIEEKQKAIIDSINYAKRIQSALLPTVKYIEKQMLKKNKI